MNIIEACQKAKDEGVTVKSKHWGGSPVLYKENYSAKGLTGFFEIRERDQWDDDGNKLPEKMRYLCPLNLLFEETVLGEWEVIEPVGFEG